MKISLLIFRENCSQEKLHLRIPDLYIFIDPRSFPLTDATSLLMRLQMEPESIGIDLKDRWREVGNMYQNIVETDSTMFIFDDFHNMNSKELLVP